MVIGRLHVITPQDRSPVACAREAAAAGSPVVQLRIKDTSDRDRFALTEQVADVCTAHGTTLIVNDRVDLAQAVGADGVHLGADDLPVAAARKVLGPEKLIGATVRDTEAARRAEDEGASYLGVGPAYTTSTKYGLPDPLGPERIGKVASAVGIPVIAIGGVTPDHVPTLLGAGAHGVAVVGAVWSASDPGDVVHQILSLMGAAT